MTRRHATIVQVFAHEPELLTHVPETEAEAARHRTVVTSLSLPRGDLSPPAVRSDPFDLGFLVLEGILLRRVEVAGRRTVELLGPGDVIRPWRDDAGENTLRVGESWKIWETGRIAVLDRRFEQDVARWPGVVSGLLERVAARAERLAVQLALAQLPRLAERLLLLLWHIAGRFGHVEPRGVVLPALLQDTLAEMAASQRPSVSGALARLRDRGLIVADGRGRWVLVGEPHEAESLVHASRLPSPA